MTRTRIDRRLSTVVVGALICAVAACSATANQPGSDKDPAPGSAAASSPAGKGYTIKGFDLCEATDLTPFANLSPDVEKRKPRRLQYDGLLCLVVARTKAGNVLALDVVAYEKTSTESAVDGFLSHRRNFNTGLHDNGDIDGIGDEAFGKSRDDQGRWEHLIEVRSDNLLVRVLLRMEKEPGLTPSELTPKLRDIARGILDAAPKR